MTLHTLYLRAPRRAPAKSARSPQDHSLTFALGLILALIFGPIIGAHIVFAFLAEPPQAQTLHVGRPALARMDERSPS